MSPKKNTHQNKKTNKSLNLTGGLTTLPLLLRYSEEQFTTKDGATFGSGSMGGCWE